MILTFRKMLAVSTKHCRLIVQAALLVLISVALGLVTMAIHGEGLKQHLKELTQTGYQPSLDLFPEESEIRRVSLAEAKSFLAVTNAVILDARSSQDFQKSHIAGARSLPESRLDEAFARQIDLFIGKEKFLVYCDGKHCQMSLRVGQRLQEAGLREVVIFPGGWRQWNEALLPVESQ